MESMFYRCGAHNGFKKNFSRQTRSRVNNSTPLTPLAKHALNVTSDQVNLTHVAIACKIIEHLEQITLKVSPCPLLKAISSNAQNSVKAQRISCEYEWDISNGISGNWLGRLGYKQENEELGMLWREDHVGDCLVWNLAL